ncbi:MAG: PIN domain-containing protein [Pseudonocardia sp.]
MIACDTSVLVAAFDRTNSAHDVAVAALRRSDALIEHVAVETFSVLTRLPVHHRAPPELAARFLAHHFPAEVPRLPSPGADVLIATGLRTGISGGAVYDLMVGLAAAHASSTLLSLDRRAARTYEAADVDHTLLPNA